MRRSTGRFPPAPAASTSTSSPTSPTRIETQLLRRFAVAGVRGHDRRHAERRHSDSGLEDADVASRIGCRVSKAACGGAICPRWMTSPRSRGPRARRRVWTPMTCSMSRWSTDSTTRSWCAAASTTSLDEEPPIVGGTIGQTQPGTYDILGRYYYLGLQLGF